MQKIEDVTGNDYNKMTQLDPNLKQEALANYDKASRMILKTPRPTTPAVSLDCRTGTRC